MIRKGARIPFRLRHEPPSPERETWKYLEDHLLEDIVPHKLASEGIRADEEVRHNLGRKPSEVQILVTRPIDGFTAFSVWEPDPSKRTDKTITIRTDSIMPGDIVEIKVR
jgi:hypothetical protein